MNNPEPTTGSSLLAEQRVLLLHNRYRTSGGEEQYVDRLAQIVRKHGGEAKVLERSSSEAGSIGAARGLVRGGTKPDEVGRAVREFGANIVHAHNVHPTFGWRALAAARDAGAAVVLHLHNYRLFCAIGTVFRDGKDCVECAPNSTVNGLKHNCRGSFPQAAAYAVGLNRWQGELINSVDLFVSPVAQLGEDLDELGLGLSARVLPTCMPDAEFTSRSHCADGEYGIFVGRIAEEKGVRVAIEAAARSGVPLRIAGDGPQIVEAQRLATKLEAPVEFLGQLDGQALVAARMGAAFAVVPSIWREVLPLSALESLAAGLPLLTSDRGGLPELTETQLVSKAGDVAGLAEVMQRMFSDRDARQAAGERAHDRARERFSESAFVPRLAEIYRDACR